MAMNIVTLTAGITKAFIDSGAIPCPSLVALSAGLAKAIIDAVHEADVDPETGVPPMTSPSGPVTGKGRIK